MKSSKTNKKIFKILKLVVEQIADVYLYFLGFYVVCLMISLFSERWKLFFNWPVFHISVVVLGILSALSDKGQAFIRAWQASFFSKIGPVTTKVALDWVSARSIRAVIKRLIVFTLQRVKRFTKTDYLKICLILVVQAYSLLEGINPVNFFILCYALVSVLFILESRIAAAIALLFLVSCPILLILKKGPIAETMAIYAYYFLIIATATQLREYWREERAKKVIHS